MISFEDVQNEYILSCNLANKFFSGKRVNKLGVGANMEVCPQ